MSENQLTIVIPVHNRAKIVRRTLDDIAAQVYRPLSVILVDNNSTDNTLDVLNEWAEAVSAPDFVVTVSSEPTPGAAAARNRGLSLVKTPWIMFFDSDDLMDAHHVERAMTLAADDVDLVGWPIRRVELDGSSRVLPFTSVDFDYNILFHAVLATQRYMVRTDRARLAGGWNESVMRWNDIEFGLRLVNHIQHPRALSGAPTVTVMAQEDSISGTSFSGSADQILVSLERMSQTLGANRRRWISLKTTIYAAVCHREKSERASELLDSVLKEEQSAFWRFMWRVAYRYTAIGGRGVARLYKPLLK